MQPQVQTCTTYLEEHVLASQRFQHFSTVISLVRGVAFVIHMARSYKNSNQNDKCRGLHRCNLPRAMDEMDQAKDVILKATQKADFAKELSAFQAGKVVPENSPMRKLSPSLEEGLVLGAD